MTAGKFLPLGAAASSPLKWSAAMPASGGHWRVQLFTVCKVLRRMTGTK